MINDAYREKVIKIVTQWSKGKKVQVFLFGSAARKQRFHDCDLGVMGKVTRQDIARLKEVFQESTLPYKVDVVDFNQVSEAFKQNVFKSPIVWIKR